MTAAQDRIIKTLCQFLSELRPSDQKLGIILVVQDASPTDHDNDIQTISNMTPTAQTLVLATTVKRAIEGQLEAERNADVLGRLVSAITSAVELHVHIPGEDEVGH